MSNVSESYKEVTEGKYAKKDRLGEFIMTNFVFSKLYLDDPYQERGDLPATIKLINRKYIKPMIVHGGPLKNIKQGSLRSIMAKYE